MPRDRRSGAGIAAGNTGDLVSEIQPHPGDERDAAGTEAGELRRAVIGQVLAADVEAQPGRDLVAQMRVEIDASPTRIDSAWSSKWLPR